MKLNKGLFLPLILGVSLNVGAAQSDIYEYEGKVSDIYIGKGNRIKVGVTVDEDEPLVCDYYDDKQWPLYFEFDKSYSAQWFELINLARRTQEPIRIGYLSSDDSSCAIEYLAFSKGNGTDTDGANGQGDGLIRSGTYGNIAMIYTNNLTESNYTASDHYNVDRASAAFDGHTYAEQIDDKAGDKIERGFWMVKKDPDNKEQEYWLQVRFDKAVNITGFRIMINSQSVSLGRSPRGITIQTSTDGKEFNEHESFTLSKAVDQRGVLTESVEAKYFRVRVDSNFGDKFIEIDELEVYSEN